MKTFQFLCISLSLLLPVASSSAQRGGSVGSTSSFTLDKRMELPGKILKPGTYSIQILDNLSDRMIVRISNTETRFQYVLLAVPASAFAGKGSRGIVSWPLPADGTPAVRGFVFPSNREIEFVYPKSEAAALAKANNGRVIAVDPDSEGRPALAQMSSEDMTVIHLWLLSLKPVGPDQKEPAIQAQAYQPPVMIPSKKGKLGSVELASIDRTPDQFGTAVNAQPTPRKRPAISALPHTASDLPLIFLVGLCSLFASFGLRFVAIASKSGPLER